MATKAELAIDLPVPSDQAFDATYRALGTLGFGVVNADPAAGIISAKSSVDLMSWGENLELFVQPVTAISSTVIVRSALKFGLVDWGKNKKNVAKVEAAIRAQLGALPGAPAGAPAPPPPPLPPPPPPPAAASAATTGGHAAGWHPDPSGRHQHRWWDGHRWTDAVSTNGATSTDPVPPPA
ncbi:MAG: hypothetical protein JWO77_1303 [Ilumatobacteraceae bacterium]|nr:hypothetical protein [Ilumatobacteraceae bacterium]